MMRFWLLIPARIRSALVWAGTAVAVAFGFYQAGRKSAHQDNEIDELQNEVEAHERLNKAPTGAGLSDADIRRELQSYAKRNGG